MSLFLASECRQGAFGSGIALTCARSRETPVRAIEVFAVGFDASRVGYIQVTWSDNRLDDKLAVEQLGNYAALHYANSDPARARAWLAANIGTAVRFAADTGAVALIGGVRLSIKKVPSMGDYILELAAAG